jgi:hypothetical protein
METTITGIVYPGMLQQFLVPQLDEDDQERCIHLQQDGTPPYYIGEVCEHLSIHFPGRWTVKSSANSMATSFPGSYALRFFLWGFIKDRVFVPLLLANVIELRTRITTAVTEVTQEMLRSLWQETDYRWDVCCIIKWKSH